MSNESRGEKSFKRLSAQGFDEVANLGDIIDSLTQDSGIRDTITQALQAFASGNFGLTPQVGDRIKEGIASQEQQSIRSTATQLGDRFATTSGVRSGPFQQILADAIVNSSGQRATRNAAVDQAVAQQQFPDLQNALAAISGLGQFLTQEPALAAGGAFGLAPTVNFGPSPAGQAGGGLGNILGSLAGNLNVGPFGSG